LSITKAFLEISYYFFFIGEGSPHSVSPPR
jgi:hypothetical protein